MVLVVEYAQRDSLAVSTFRGVTLTLNIVCQSALSPPGGPGDQEQPGDTCPLTLLPGASRSSLVRSPVEICHLDRLPH